jgi:hypothetical protein
MSTSGTRNSNSLAWFVVAVAGVVVLVIVWGLELHDRLDAGQRVLDGARPIFVEERVEGDRVGITIIGNVADTYDPIIDEQGGAAGEVGSLVELVAGATGLPAEDVLAALEANFPHTYHLLLTLPLDQVSAEVPVLLNFVAENSELADAAEVFDAIEANTPHLAQAIGNLLVVTDGFREIPGIEPLTRFDGTPVQSIPEVITYFDDDVIAGVRAVAVDYRTVDTTAPPADVFPALLLILGILVVIYGAAMLSLTSAYTPKRKEPEGGAPEASEPVAAESSERTLETVGSTPDGG